MARPAASLRRCNSGVNWSGVSGGRRAGRKAENPSASPCWRTQRPARVAVAGIAATLDKDGSYQKIRLFVLITRGLRQSWEGPAWQLHKAFPDAFRTRESLPGPIEEEQYAARINEAFAMTAIN